MNFDFFRLVPYAWRAFQQRADIGLLAADIQAVYEAAKPAIAELEKRWPEINQIGRSMIAAVAPEVAGTVLEHTERWEPTTAWIQGQLHQRGFYKGDIDGVYGSATEQAVRDFQKSVGLDVDGVAGPDTVGALLARPA